MNTRLRFFFILIGALLVAATYTFPNWQPFFAQTQTTGARDVFADLAPELQPTFQALPQAQLDAYRARAIQNGQAALAMARAALQPPAPVPEPEQALPSMSGPVVVATGEFTQLDPIRWATGTITIYEQADNNKVLRFETFTAVNGPELHVILSTSAQPEVSAGVMLNNNADIDLGVLRGTQGNQNYRIPPEIDLSRYNSIILLSRSLNLVYSYAPLIKS